MTDNTLRQRSVFTNKNSRQRDILRGRLTASEINAFRTPGGNGSGLITGQGKYIPVLYGQMVIDNDNAVIIEQGEDGSSNLIIGVAWCMGEAGGVLRCFINDVSLIQPLK